MNKLKASSGKCYALQFKTEQNQELFPNDFQSLPVTVKEQVVYQIIYDGYLQRETKVALRLSKAEHLSIPPDFSYHDLPGLRSECKEKLSLVRPDTLGQASRIAGVNPADITIIHIYLQRFLNLPKDLSHDLG